MGHIINEHLVFLELSAENKDMAICMLASELEKERRVSDSKEFAKAVLEREEVFPTAIGLEAAIPHGKSSCVLQTTIAYARLKTPILWEDDEYIRHIIMLAVPEEAAGDVHMHMLAELSRNLMCEEFRERLFHQSSQKEIVEQIIQMKV